MMREAPGDLPEVFRAGGEPGLSVVIQFRRRV